MPKNGTDLVHLHLYLSDRDYDLQLLYQSRRLKDAIRQGISKYLNNDALITVSLPEYQPVKPETRRASVYFSPKEDAEVINFIKTIPRGNVNAVLQLLVRNVLRKADIRQLMDPEAGKRKKAVQGIKTDDKSGRNQPKTSATSYRPPDNSASSFKPDVPIFDDEDDIFAEI